MIKFNPIIRGAKRQENNEQDLFKILDAGFLCNIAYSVNNQTYIIPTIYGRKKEKLYFHGSNKNFTLLQIAQLPQISVSITHLDGIVLATSLFDSSANYRSVVLNGRTAIIKDDSAKLDALKIISEQIIPNRWDEVTVGTSSQVQATLVVEFIIESASVKIRQGGPQGDENNPQSIWSGHIPIKQICTTPVGDSKFNKQNSPVSPSVKAFFEKNKQ